MKQTNKKEEKRIKFSYRSVFFSLILIFGIVLAFVLYLNISYQIKEKDANSVNKSLQENLLLETKNNEILPEKKLDAKPTSTTLNCEDLAIFMQEYYYLKLKAEQGQDFSEQLIKLSKYQINSLEIKNLFSKLVNLAPDNVKNEYFRIKFSENIKEIYFANSNKESFLARFIFIRPIGERAMEREGLDKEIALTEKALLDNNLNLAKIHMEKIPNPSNSLNSLLLKLKNKLAIEEAINAIDKLLINGLDCRIIKR